MIRFTTAFAKLAAKAAMGLTTLLLTASAFAAEDHDVDLKLFGEADVSSSSGCWFSLWQKNRDPAKDKYAYVFYAPISGGVEDTARMKIGKDFVALSRDGNWRDNGRELAHYIGRVATEHRCKNLLLMIRPRDRRTVNHDLILPLVE